METETYFVGSNGEEPNKIYFNKGAAMLGGDLYLDSFDSDGNKVNSYKLVGKGFYTNSF